MQTEDCERFLARNLDDYVDGELAGEALEQAEAHLADCTTCRAVVEDTRKLATSAQALPRDVAPPDGLWPSVAAAIAPPGPVAKPFGFHGRKRTRWDVAAMAAAVVLVALSHYLGGPSLFHGGWLAEQISVGTITRSGDTIDVRKPFTGTTVSVSNLAGQVRVVAWDEATVAVAGTLSPEVTGVTFDVTDAAAVIAVHYPNQRCSSSGSRLTVHVPRSVRCSVATVSASASVEGVAGGVDVHAVSGAVTVEDCHGAVSATSVSGAIDVRGDEILSLEAKSTSGSVDFRGALLADGTYTATTVSGAVHIEVPRGTAARVDLSTLSGLSRKRFDNGAPGPSAPSVRVKTLSGHIDMTSY